MATKPRRFWRGKLPTIVWDKRNNRTLCDLSEGHFTTEDEYTIGVLREIGYIEIPLDAVRPPDIIEPIQPNETVNIRLLPAGLTEKGAARIEEGKALLVEVEDPDGPAVPKPKSKTDVKLKNTPSNSPKKTRDLKRRAKK